MDETVVVVLSTADWDAPVWTNKQYMATELAREFDVVYVESLGLRAPQLGFRDLRRIAKRASPTRASSRPRPPRLEVVAPRVVPRHDGVAARWNGRYMRRLWRQIFADPTRRYVLWTFSPVTYGAERFADAAVYHCVDLIGEQPGFDAGLIERHERRLACQGVPSIGSSHVVCDHLRSMGFEHVEEWPNVARVEPFLAAGRTADERQRRVVFGGNLSPFKVDFELLGELVDALPGDVELVLAGPEAEGGGTVTQHLDRLRQKGVRLAGNLDLSELARLFGRSTVGIIPYVLNSYTAGVSPLKAAEYMAAGLAVVATPLPCLAPIPDAIRVAPRRDFVSAVLDSVDPPSEQQLDTRQREASRRSWVQRGDNARARVRELSSCVAGRASRAEVRFGPDVDAAPTIEVATVTHGSLEGASVLVSSLAQQELRIDVAIVHNGPRHHGPAALGRTLDEFRRVLPKDGGAIGRLLLVDAGTNLGYSGGLNLAVAELGSGAPYLWLMNPDVRVHADAAARLAESAASHPDVWCWGSTHISPEQPGRVAVAGFVELAAVSGRRIRRGTEVPLSDLTGEAIVRSRRAFIPGSALFMPRWAYEQLGGLDDRYFLYFEEADLARRIFDRGGHLGWCRGSRVVHQGQGSTAGRPDTESSIARHSTRSHLRFLRRHEHAFLVPFAVMWRLARVVLPPAGRSRSSMAEGTLRGLVDAVAGARPSAGGTRR